MAGRFVDAFFRKFYFDKWDEKWQEKRDYYIISHQHGDHIRKPEYIPEGTEIIVSEHRFKRYTVFSNFKPTVIKEKEFVSFGDFKVRIINTTLHSDVIEVIWKNIRALLFGDISAHQTDSIIDILKNAQPDVVMLPVYSKGSKHIEEEIYYKDLNRAVGEIVKRLHWKRFFPKRPYIVALQHSDNAKKPKWADAFVKKFPTGYFRFNNF